MTSDGRKRRITELLLGYWKIIKADRQFPDEADVNPDDISDIWENCFMVKIINNGGTKDYVYMHTGKMLEKAYGYDLTLDDTPPLASSNVERLVNKYEEVCNNKSPLIEEDSFVNAQGKTIRYRQILLPLGPNDDEVSHILGGMRYKIHES